jgi:SulP family sulfate permease
LGPVPQGLPALGLPTVHLSDLNSLLPLALACFILAAVETAAIGRMFTAKHGGRFDSNQEFLGLATANLAAGLGRGFPVSGGMSQSLVNESGGAKSSLSGLVAAIIMLIVCLFLSGLLHNLPQPVLAAIVLVAVAGLFNVAELSHVFHADRKEFVVAIAALLGVLGSGLLHGVLIGAVISLVQLLRRASQPHVALLGRIPGTQRFSDLARHPENKPVPDVMIFRIESSLLYFNVDYTCDAMLEQVHAADPLPKMVLCDLSNSPFVDLQSAAALRLFADELAAKGIRLQLVEARASVRDRLRAEGLEERVGGIDRLQTVAQVIDEWSVSATPAFAV